MITEQEILETIENLLHDPISITGCGKIASLMVMHDHLFGEDPYSKTKNAISIIETDGSSDFLCAINGRESSEVLALIDELMDAVKVLQPRIYDAVMDRLNR